MGVDPFDIAQDTPDTARLGPARHAFAITPSDTTDLTRMTRAVMASGAGTIAAIFEGDTSAVTIQVAANQMYAWHVTRVKATGTTATGITGFS